MKARFLILLLACATALRADPVPIPDAEPEPVPAPAPIPEDPRVAAKREAWMSAVLIVSLLDQGDNEAFPGIRAWLEDFHQIAASTPPPENGKPFPSLDAEALVTRNPHFWSAFFEIQPGDPGLALLHAALLLSGGESQRASILATFGLQRPGIPAEIKRALTSLIAHCQSAQAQSAQLVRDGVALYDRRDFTGALGKFDRALAEWPANGGAHYERGSTLRMRAIEEARRVSKPADTTMPAAVGDPPGTAECFARARRFHPFHLLAYQGDDPAILAGMMALVRSGLPVWEAMRKHPEQPIKTAPLRAFSEACREAAIDDFALVLRQLVVATNRRYASADREFIDECLRRLAPAALTEPLLARVSGETRLPARQIVVPIVVEPPDSSLTKAEEGAPPEVKKKEPAAKPKAKGKTSSGKKKSPATKAKTSTAKKSPPAKSKSKSKSSATKKKKGAS